MSRLDQAVLRATDRVGRVLDAIEAGDIDGTSKAIKEIKLAQPWDIVSIGHSFMLDSFEEVDDEQSGPTSDL